MPSPTGEAVDGGFAIADRGDDGNGGIDFQRAPEDAADDRRIVDDHDPDGHGGISPWSG